MMKLMTRRGFAAPFVLVGVLVLLLAFGGVYYLGKSNSTLPLSPTSPVSTAALSPSSTPGPSGVAIYTNSKLGFSFDYPAEYFKFQQQFDFGVYLAPSAGKGGNGPKFLELNDVWVDVTTQSGANLKSLEEYLNLPGQQTYPPNSQRTLTTIGGVKGYIIDYVSPVSAGNITRYSKEGVVLKGETIYKISLSAWSPSVLQANLKIIDQILSTFKFTDPAKLLL